MPTAKPCQDTFKFLADRLSRQSDYSLGLFLEIIIRFVYAEHLLHTLNNISYARHSFFFGNRDGDIPNKGTEREEGDIETKDVTDPERLLDGYRKEEIDYWKEAAGSNIEKACEKKWAFTI